MKRFIVFMLVVSFSLNCGSDTSKGFGFSFDDDGGINFFFDTDDNHHHHNHSHHHNNPTYQNDLKYIMEKYGIHNGKIVPMFQNEVCVGSALVTGNEAYRISYVVRVDEIDGMRVQIPMTRGGMALASVNVIATQYGNVHQWRQRGN